VLANLYRLAAHSYYQAVHQDAGISNFLAPVERCNMPNP